MNTSAIALLALLSVATGCSTDAHVFRDQPLVAKVEPGMSQDQVQSIGGKPLSVSDRTVEPGTCFDYMLTQSGRTQPYHVSFDAAGKVDHQSFMTCAQWSHAQQKSREAPTNMGGVGGSGY
ncbi:osmotically-inducible lipoprotein OsmE [Pseudomonas sp. GD03860]|uniref:osmotically-inducible lipoprotein OsmE n=1 Tax=Pseudomonas TaxID=286 RepID=UPI0023646919|nr:MULTISPECIES: osmotically-inducible lipoprotein OsmE [Pseudomonas]MDD2058908.1 osmotically-inducible lipoprotein OsmE [Pseudomonas putida]MDH0639848.1 osmotically-inducible lipoprotein OsmE [Pseudomonas sp. GD03860]